MKACLYAFAAGLGLFLGAASALAVEEDWDFTPKDYQTLMEAGGSLKFEADSEWAPVELRENLLNTLNYVLDPKLAPSSTEGINVKDFYHGHLGCDGPNRLSEIREEVSGIETRVFAPYELAWYDAPTPATLDKFIAAVKDGEAEWGKYLTRVLNEGYCEKPVVIYHTFEMSGPSMAPGDPRRNLRTAMGDAKPTHYSPPDRGSASSWMNEYSNIFQFAFLVDQRGVAHMTWSSTLQLSRVTGRSEK
ncbi:MAG: hypothetical protein AB7P04_07295 [Bacteriovoracia bacterium]